MKMKETILQVRNVTKNYSRIAAVKKFDMTIDKGDIYGLIGRNGAARRHWRESSQAFQFLSMAALRYLEEDGI